MPKFMFYTQLNIFIFYAHHVQENTFNGSLRPPLHAANARFYRPINEERDERLANMYIQSNLIQ